MTTEIDICPERINRFVKTARRGGHPAASGGEKVAHKLAKALHGLGDDLALLDADLLLGALDLARLMNGPWPTERFREVVFNTVESAAGKAPRKRKVVAA